MKSQGPKMVLPPERDKKREMFLKSSEPVDEMQKIFGMKHPNDM